MNEQTNPLRNLADHTLKIFFYLILNSVMVMDQTSIE